MMFAKTGRRGGLVAAGLLLLGASVLAAGPGDFQLGDDLIGTLPVLYPETPTGGLTSGPQSTEGPTDAGSPYGPEASFTMLGEASTIEALLVDAYGAGWVEVEKTAEPRVLLFSFHGDFNLVLDREQLERSRFTVTLRPGASDLGGVGVVGWQGSIVSSYLIDGPELDLPVRDLLLTGALDKSPVSSVLYGGDGGMTYLDISTYGDQVFVDQLSY